MAHRSKLSDEKAARILLGLRDGKTPRELWTTPEILKSYCAVNLEYGNEALPWANTKAALRRKGARLRDQTHCKHGHSLANARFFYQRSDGYLAASNIDPSDGLPTRAVMAPASTSP
jgi:hypothetical protein